jgi:hypothetical protein
MINTVATELLAANLESERLKIVRLEILFGLWWRHYTAPHELRWTLWAERSLCPYCGSPLPAPSTPQTGAAGDDTTVNVAHIDHMDPLSRGGADAVCNAVYVCAGCNLAKGRKLFVRWLSQLDGVHAEAARTLYEVKQGIPPEAFVPGRPQPRRSIPHLELALDESVLRRLYPRPVVRGPPKRNSTSTA